MKLARWILFAGCSSLLLCSYFANSYQNVKTEEMTEKSKQILENHINGLMNFELPKRETDVELSDEDRLRLVKARVRNRNRIGLVVPEYWKTEIRKLEEAINKSDTNEG